VKYDVWSLSCSLKFNTYSFVCMFNMLTYFVEKIAFQIRCGYSRVNSLVKLFFKHHISYCNWTCLNLNLNLTVINILLLLYSGSKVAMADSNITGKTQALKFGLVFQNSPKKTDLTRPSQHFVEPTRPCQKPDPDRVGSGFTRPMHTSSLGSQRPQVGMYVCT